MRNQDPTGDREASLASVTDTELLQAFREAILAVYPILKRLSCIEDDTQPYDEFDEVVEKLWEIVVLGSLMWREGLAQPPNLPRYGFGDVAPGADGYIEVAIMGRNPLRFIGFVGSREFGAEPFNAVRCVGPDGTEAVVAIQSIIAFRWAR